MQKTCWKSCTRYDMALYLILMIAVIFLIIMVTLYALFFFVWNESEDCDRMCNVIIMWQQRGSGNFPSEKSDYGKPERIDTVWPFPGLEELPLRFVASDNRWREPPVKPNPTVVYTTASNATDTTTLAPQTTTKRRRVTKKRRRTRLPETTTEPITRRRRVTTTTTEVTESTTRPTRVTTTTTEVTESTRRRKRVTLTERQIRRNPPQNTELPKPVNQKREVQFEKLIPVAALLENLYYDDDKEKVLTCVIARISSKWALTLTNCLENNFFEWHSVYFVESGLKKIKQVFQYQELTAIELVPSETEPDFNSFEIAAKSNTSNSVRAYFWEENSLLPLIKRKRNQKMQFRDLELSTLARLQPNVISFPLFDLDQNLIGFKSGPTYAFFTANESRAYRSFLEKLGAFR